MHSRLFKIAVIVMLMLPQALYAAEISIDSQSYYALSAEDKAGEERDIGTFYEYLTLSISSGENYSFLFSGWGSTETLDEHIWYEDDEKEDGNISAAYFEYFSEDSNLILRLGKQAVLNLGSYEGMSGLSFRTDLPYHLKISAFAGIPEELEDKSSEDDMLEGGRLSAGYPGYAELGIGYLKETDADIKFREETSYDLWLMPTSKFEFYLENVKNNITKSDAYTSYELNVYATNTITVMFKQEEISYEDYYAGAEVRIFDYYNVGEELKSSSTSIVFNATSTISLRLTMSDYKFDKSDDASSFGGGIKLTTDDVLYGFTYNSTNSDDVTEGSIDEYRFYAMTRSEDGIYLSGDIIYDNYENKINDTDTALTVIASIGYQIDDDLSVALDIEYNDNPEYKEDTRAFARLAYSFGKEIDFSAKEAEEEKETEAAAPVPVEEPAPPVEEKKPPVEETAHPLPQVTPPVKETLPVEPVKEPPVKAVEPKKGFPMKENAPELGPAGKPYDVKAWEHGVDKDL